MHDLLETCSSFLKQPPAHNPARDAIRVEDELIQVPQQDWNTMTKGCSWYVDKNTGEWMIHETE